MMHLSVCGAARAHDSIWHFIFGPASGECRPATHAHTHTRFLFTKPCRFPHRTPQSTPLSQRHQKKQVARLPFHSRGRARIFIVHPSTSHFTPVMLRAGSLLRLQKKTPAALAALLSNLHLGTLPPHPLLPTHCALFFCSPTWKLPTWPTLHLPGCCVPRCAFVFSVQHFSTVFLLSPFCPPTPPSLYDTHQHTVQRACRPPLAAAAALRHSFLTHSSTTTTLHQQPHTRRAPNAARSTQ